MGNAQSGQGNQGGPYFGGHYAGDFSIRRGRPDMNKPLPEVPQTKTVRFGHAPPAWEFYRNTPTWDNTANTRYCAPAHSASTASPPPSYSHPISKSNSNGQMYVWNR